MRTPKKIKKKKDQRQAFATPEIRYRGLCGSSPESRKLVTDVRLERQDHIMGDLTGHDKYFIYYRPID